MPSGRRDQRSSSATTATTARSPTGSTIRQWSWQTQHAEAVTTNGVEGCLEVCHDTKFCQDCHNELKPVPSSHKGETWLHNELTVTKYPDEAAKPSADHAVKATQAPDSCEVCHGAGGPNAKFCTDCHGFDMPHPDDFKEFHSKTGRDNAAACQNCHQFPEICSNCHHAGSSPWKPWAQVHGGVVNEQGAESVSRSVPRREEVLRRLPQRGERTSRFAQGQGLDAPRRCRHAGQAPGRLRRQRRELHVLPW